MNRDIMSSDDFIYQNAEVYRDQDDNGESFTIIVEPGRGAAMTLLGDDPLLATILEQSGKAIKDGIDNRTFKIDRRYNI
jgi:hypothetical protein